MANITYLIGNGFDLGLGLRTSFSDFLPIYIKDRTKSENILRFKENIEKSIINWSDFEKQLGLYTKELFAEDVELFLDQKEDFETEFMKYLNVEQKRCIIDDDVAKQFANALNWWGKTDVLRDIPRGKIRKICESARIEYSFINFNYTDTLDRIIQLIKRKSFLSTRMVDLGDRIAPVHDVIGRIVHVHGAINNDPILGVNDEGQIANKDFLQNPDLKRLLIKHEMNEMAQRGFEERAEELIRMSDVICVYGMSLGETDKRWWIQIGEWIKDPGHYLVIFNWDNKYKATERNRIKKMREIQKSFLKYPFPNVKDEDLPNPRLNVFCSCHKNIFEFDLENKIEKMQEVAVAKDDFDKE